MCYHVIVVNGKVQGYVAAVMIAMLGWIIADQRSLRSYVQTEMREVRSDIADLRERMARLEGRVDTLVDVFRDRESPK